MFGVNKYREMSSGSPQMVDSMPGPDSRPIQNPVRNVQVVVDENQGGWEQDFGSFNYKMDSPKRGLFLILNFQIFDDEDLNRYGSEEDVKNLTETVSKLGFKIDVWNDLKTSELYKKLENVSQQNHGKADCLACAILSHGGKADKIYTKNGSIKLTEIIEHFNADKCQSFAGKPKLFFVQACRGEKVGRGLKGYLTSKYDNIDGEKTKQQSIPIAADFFIAQSTMPGEVSIRNAENGSIFINELCRAFNNLQSDEELHHMMLRVNRRVALYFEANVPGTRYDKHKQMPSMTSRLTGKVVFSQTSNLSVEESLAPKSPVSAIPLSSDIDAIETNNKSEPALIKDELGNEKPKKIWWNSLKRNNSRINTLKSQLFSRGENESAHHTKGSQPKSWFSVLPNTEK